LTISACLLVGVASLSLTTAPPDTRLASASKVYVIAIDDLEGDRPVAACVAQHLPTALPSTVVSTKDEADLILRVKARLSGETTRKLTGALGLIELTALAPDGKKLWDGFRSESTSSSSATPPPANGGRALHPS